MLNPRRDQRSSPIARALVLAAVALHPAFAAAQEAGGSIRGRVAAEGGAPVENVRVVAQSPSLTNHRETLTSSQGDYLFAFLPTGDYVVTYAREDLVTVKRTTRLSALETVMADVVLPVAKAADQSITVVIDPEVFPRLPAFSENHQRSTVEHLPVEGGLLSALTLSSGALNTRLDGALVTLDGAPVRFAGLAPGRPLLDPGRAALQEATFVTGGVPVEAGRFQSGLAAIVTHTGGDYLAVALGGSVTTGDMNADALGDARATDRPAANAHYQIGGPLAGSGTRLFVAGRHLAETITAQTRLSGTALSTSIKERFWEVRATHALDRNHRLQGLFVTGARKARGAPPVGAASAEDAAALEDRTHSHQVATGVYTGVVGRNLHVVARLSGERFTSTFEGPTRGGADLVGRTGVRDGQTGGLIWAPGGCVPCDPDERTSTTWRVAASYLLSTPSDAHGITAGADGASGRLDPAGVPSGGAFELRASRFVERTGGIFPVLEPNGSAEIVWRPPHDNRLTHGADAFFVSDEWRRGSNLTIQAGLRWDRQRLSRLDGQQRLLTERGFSPRVSVSWSPLHASGWVVTSGYARYAGDLLHGISPVLAGPAERRFLYQGPPVNASSNANLVETRAVVNDALDWLFANGGTGRAPSFASEPGLTTVIPGVSGLPHESEWTIGASQEALGAARLRADLTWRRAGNLREWRVDPGDSSTDAAGRSLDQATLARSDLLARNYAALTLQFHYKMAWRGRLAARYTLSRTWGTAAAVAHDDPLRSMALAYPEYVDAEWAAPSGDLSEDRRHRVKVWDQADLLVSDSLGIVGIDVLHTMESGRPYGLVSWIDVSPFVANPGYLQPPAAVPYYFTARDAFRTKVANRTDLSVRYTRHVPASVRGELLVQFHVLNLFNRRHALAPEGFAVATTALTEPGRLTPFNPFTQSPEPDIHWRADPRLSSTLAAAMTLPRAYRLSVGLRF